jgi:hypothetical protein
MAKRVYAENGPAGQKGYLHFDGKKRYRTLFLLTSANLKPVFVTARFYHQCIEIVVEPLATTVQSLIISFNIID